MDTEDNLNECLSSIFCLADLFNPDADREEYEFDDVRKARMLFGLVA
ncbi:colicin immunity domain-containing protein [Vibrio sp. PP-XX7]